MPLKFWSACEQIAGHLLHSVCCSWSGVWLQNSHLYQVLRGCYCCSPSHWLIWKCQGWLCLRKELLVRWLSLHGSKKTDVLLLMLSYRLPHRRIKLGVNAKIKRNELKVWSSKHVACCAWGQVTVTGILGRIGWPKTVYRKEWLGLELKDLPICKETAFQLNGHAGLWRSGQRPKFPAFFSYATCSVCLPESFPLQSRWLEVWGSGGTAPCHSHHDQRFQ